MKIDKPGKPLPTHPISEGSVRVGANKSKSGKSSTPLQPDHTSVSLGSVASQLQGMENSMANVPISNSAKVEEIKQAISDGRFKINTEVVASRLLETVRDLIGNKA